MNELLLKGLGHAKQCFFPREVLKDINTLVFVLNPAYAAWQAQHVLAPKASDPQHSWLNCRLDTSKCNYNQLEILQAKYGRPIDLDEMIKVDLIVIGPVAVDRSTGARLGKGEGFAELEYGMLRYMGAIDDSTMIVTTVHDKQLVDDIPVEKLLVHDVPVDIICTPTWVIFTNTTIPKPQGLTDFHHLANLQTSLL